MKLQNFMFPYSPTEKAAITYEMHEKYIELEMKLPVKPAPYQRKDWKWLKAKLAIPEAIQEKIKTAVNIKPHLPELRFQKLKAGLLISVLQFSWDYLKETLDFTFFHDTFDRHLQLQYNHDQPDNDNVDNKNIYQIHFVQLRYNSRLYDHVLYILGNNSRYHVD